MEPKPTETPIDPDRRVPETTVPDTTVPETTIPDTTVPETTEALPGADGLAPMLLAFPGPLRDALVKAVLSGEKTSTTGLLHEYEVEGERLPEPGERWALLGSEERPVAVVETTGVRVIPLAEVDLRHAMDEGEGYASVAEWRAAHEEFWHSAEMRAALDDPTFTVDDTTLVVAERFRVVEHTDAQTDG